MTTETINLTDVRNHAEELFRCGDYFCSESVVSTMREFFDKDMPEALISTASGFPVGVGRTKCMCGAISGGVIALGYFFGRTKGKDPKVEKTLELAAELQGEFRKLNKVSCCSVLTKGMDMASGEHKAQCIRFTGDMAYATAKIIAREKSISTIE